LFLPEEERVAAEFCLLLLVELCERTVALLLLVLVLELLLELELVLELRCGLLTASRLLPVELCVRTELFRVSGVLLRLSGVLLRWLTADLLLADLLVVTSGRYTFTALLLTRVVALPERLFELSSLSTVAFLPVVRS
jgi:hypothetical protein